MECFATPFELVNRLEFVSEWDFQTVRTNCFLCSRYTFPGCLLRELAPQIGEKQIHGSRVEDGQFCPKLYSWVVETVRFSHLQDTCIKPINHIQCTERGRILISRL